MGKRIRLNFVPFLLSISLILILVACTEATELPQPRSYYTDREVETLIERFPSLTRAYGEDPSPHDILQQLAIDINSLTEIDSYVGDCLCFVVYSLSPSYELVVDDNACYGYQVYVRSK